MGVGEAKETSLALFSRAFRGGLADYCDRWRLKNTNPKTGVKVPMHFDLETFLCLPFELLSCATIDSDAGTITILITAEY